MAREIKILKDTKSPIGKDWLQDTDHIVGEELATKLISEGLARYTEPNELGEVIKEVKKRTKK
jgi:hypothetical protein